MDYTYPPDSFTGRSCFPQLSPHEYDVPAYTYSSSSSVTPESSPIQPSGYYSSSPPSLDPMANADRVLALFYPDQSALHPSEQSQWPRQNPTNLQVPSSHPYASDAAHLLLPQVPLHAPVPVPGYSALLSRSDPEPNIRHPPPNWSEPIHQTPAPLHTHSDTVSYLDTPLSQHQDILDFYAKASEQKFPTPSELLSQLSGAPPYTANGEPEKKVESQRKARQRAVAQSIGFEPTDPDTISSHDKKRHYLECLEAYVVFLHEQLTLVGAEPLPLERVSVPGSRGLSSRSIRTLLVHMENTVRKLHQQSLCEEQVFLKLRNDVVSQEAVAQGHSISSWDDGSQIQY